MTLLRETQFCLTREFPQGLKPKSLRCRAARLKPLPFPLRLCVLPLRASFLPAQTLPENVHIPSRTKLLVNGREMEHNQGVTGGQAN